MSEFIAALTRKNSLRKQTSMLSSEELEKVIGDLASILEKKKEQEAALAAEQEAKAQLIADIQEKMERAGIKLGVLKEAIEKELHAAPKAKYEIEVEGEVHRWSGRGRTPAVFAQYMEDHYISKDQLPEAV